MKRSVIFLTILISLTVTYNVSGWTPDTPELSNRGYFHYRKAEELFNRQEYNESLKELELAYKFTFLEDTKNVILLKSAVCLMNLHNFEEALNVIERRIAGSKWNNEFLFLKTECLQNLNRSSEAIGILNTLIDIETQKENKIFFMLKKGLLFLSLDSLDKADESFSRILEEVGYGGDNKSTDKIEEQLKLAVYSLGYIAIKQEKYEKARQFFRFIENYFKKEKIGFKSSIYLALMQKNPKRVDERFSSFQDIDIQRRNEIAAVKGYIFYENKSFEQALTFFQSIEIESLLTHNIEEMITILSAECCYKLKEYRKSVEYYQKYIEIVTSANKKMPAIYGLAWSYFRLGEYSNAYAVLKDFLVLYPRSPYISEIHRLSALSLFYVGEHNQAKYHFTKLLDLNGKLKDRDRIYYLRGKSEFYIHDFDGAEKDFNIIMARFPQSRWKPHAMRMLARISFEKENYLEAYSAYQKVIKMEISPSVLDEVRFQMERCLLYLGYYKNPIEMNKAFVRKYPASRRSIDLQLESAGYYFQLDRYWEAIREYERFLDIFPQDKNKRFVLFRLASSYYQIGFIEKSFEIYKSLSKGNDNYAESALVSMGDVLFAKGKYKESIETFKTLIKRFPDSDKRNYANFIIGKNYLELNLPEEARVFLESAANSNDSFAFKDKASLLIAKTYYIEGRGEEYLSYLDNLTKEGSQKLKAESFFLKAKYKKEIGRVKESMELFEKSSEVFEEAREKVHSLYEAGLSAEELSLYDRALDYYDRAMQISRFEANNFGIERRIERIEKMEEEP